MKKTLKSLLDGGDFGVVPEARRRVMQANVAKSTKPELTVRTLLHRMGFRFRLHRKDLPGVPDIVLPRHRKIVEVYGCFWHKHDCSLGLRSPRSNAAYWRAKIDGNAARDVKKLAALRKLGWGVLIVWECETKDVASLQKRLRGFLST